MTNVRDYTDKELLDKVKSLKSYKTIPKGVWILGVQSLEDAFNVFDDKFYVFKGEKFIKVVSGTTNAGLTGLKSYETYNTHGCAVIKTEEWYYDIWSKGKHKGKMLALKQVKPIKYFRDWNRNKKAEEIGKVYNRVIGINFHTATYKMKNMIKRFINGWSTGCQVVNDTKKYYEILDLIPEGVFVSYCLIKEF